MQRTLGGPLSSHTRQLSAIQSVAAPTQAIVTHTVIKVAGRLTTITSAMETGGAKNSRQGTLRATLSTMTPILLNSKQGPCYLLM